MDVAEREKGRELISSGKAVLGLEFGSTRIKAVLIDEAKRPVASGSHSWEDRLEEGYWTYSLPDIWEGFAACYADLCRDVQEKYGAEIHSLAAMGFSGMMHGYLPFDRDGELLVPFRTWRNTTTGEAAGVLSQLFAFNIPQRWSVAHLYQAILNGEEHVGRIDYLSTLAGYIHWRLTGRKVMGVGEASGMFPVDSGTRQFDRRMMEQFDGLVADRRYPWKLADILPEVLCAGQEAGRLTEEGARLLDPSGRLPAGIPVCPPEGDAGTGMAATNSVRVRTGNVSAGTSVFAMVVLEKGLSRAHEEIDMVTTPSGDPVAMVHCNNCTSDLNAWAGLFSEAAELFGAKPEKGELFEKLFRKALEGDAACGGLMSYNYFSGEPVTGFSDGKPLFMRKPDAAFNLANFMRTQLYTALGALKAGLDILFAEEGVKLEELMGHGGFFKTKGVGQRILAGATGTPVTVMETAGEGGAWGIALLAAYLVEKRDGEDLAAFLADRVFCGEAGETTQPDAEDVKGFQAFLESYRAGLAVERAALDWAKE